VEVPTGRPAVGAGELLDVRAGHVVIAERVDMHNTSFAEESPVEPACDLLDFLGPVVADVLVAVDAAALRRLASRRTR